MAKKKEVEGEERLEDNQLKLTAEEYWEWRTTIAEMQLAEEKVKTSQSVVQINSLTNQVFIATTARRNRDNLSSAKDEYGKLKKRIEERLGISLNNKAIDENFTVVDLPKQEE